MSRLTWKKPNGEWGVRGVDLSALPPALYGAMCRLRDFEERAEDPDALDLLLDELAGLRALARAEAEAAL